MKQPAEIMIDKEVAAYFRVSLWTLQKRMRDGFKPGEIDLNQAEPRVVCGRRFWMREKVEKLARGC